MIKLYVKEEKVNEIDIYNTALQHFTYLKSLWTKSQTAEGCETLVNMQV